MLYQKKKEHLDPTDLMALAINWCQLPHGKGILGKSFQNIHAFLVQC